MKIEIKKFKNNRTFGSIVRKLELFDPSISNTKNYVKICEKVFANVAKHETGFYSAKSITSLNVKIKGFKTEHHTIGIAVDFDQGKPELPDDLPPPSIIAESSPGKYHVYWIFNKPLPTIPNHNLINNFRKRLVPYGADPHHKTDIRILHSAKDDSNETVHPITIGDDIDPTLLLDNPVLSYTKSFDNHCINKPKQKPRQKPIPKQKPKPKHKSRRELIDNLRMKYKKSNMKRRKTHRSYQSIIAPFKAGERNSFITQYLVKRCVASGYSLEQTIEIALQCHQHPETTSVTPWSESKASVISSYKWWSEKYKVSFSLDNLSDVKMNRHHFALSKEERKVLNCFIYAASFSLSKKDCFLSEALIAARTGIKQRTVNRLIKGLIKKNKLFKTRKASFCDHIATEYRVKIKLSSDFPPSKSSPFLCKTVSAAIVMIEEKENTQEYIQKNKNEWYKPPDIGDGKLKNLLNEIY